MAENSLPTASPVVAVALPQADDNPRRRIWRRFRRHRMAMLGAVLLVLIVGAVLLAPWVTPYAPNTTAMSSRMQGPSLQHLMGTDELGRDVLTRVLYGGRISLLIGVSAMLVGVSVGMLVGALSGYFGGGMDTLIMRLVDIAIAFPSLFLLIMLASFLGSSIPTIIFVIGLLAWMRVARLVRANFMAIKRRDYVEAARALGAGGRHMIIRHLLPNSIGPVIVAATIDVSAAILTESALSYLGLGVQPPQATWGNMLRSAQDQMATAPWTAIFPGLMIFLVSIAINFIGDGLRDALDPRR